MESVIQWATGVCLCSGVVCITEMLISDTAIEKTVSFVLGAMMLCAVIVPLGGVVLDFSSDMEITANLPETIPESVEKQREQFLRESVEELIRKNLEEEKIFPDEIHVDMDIDEEKRITMITAEVTLARQKGDFAGKVRQILREELGIEAKTILA